MYNVERQSRRPLTLKKKLKVLSGVGRTALVGFLVAFLNTHN
jgi:hypothetical protein